MGAPTIIGYELVRTLPPHNKVLLRFVIDFSNVGHSQGKTVAECEPTPEAIRAMVRRIRKERALEAKEDIRSHEAWTLAAGLPLPERRIELAREELVERLCGLRDISPLFTTQKEVDALPLRSVGGHVDIDFVHDERARPYWGNSNVTKRELGKPRWRVFEVAPTGERLVAADGLTFAEAWNCAFYARGWLIDPKEPHFRPSFSFEER